jgi:thymidylate synthase (FAD)
MKIIEPSFEILSNVDGIEVLKTIEFVGRTCYKSYDKITDDSSVQFVKKLIECGHEAMIEHYNITVKIICDRGVSHELVRHRVASYAQESTRYCNYSHDRFNNEITVITPFGLSSQQYYYWHDSCTVAEKCYFAMLESGSTPQMARSVLPTSLKTEIVVTMNLREWRHFFKLRTAIGAHPQMREITIPMLSMFKKLIPVVFDDIMS